MPLALWFVASLIAPSRRRPRHALQWLGAPVAAILMVLLIGALFYHAPLGLQVVVEDYVHHEGSSCGLILLRLARAFFLAVAGIFAVLRLAFGG